MSERQFDWSLPILDWGLPVVRRMVRANKDDLVILGFGANFAIDSR